jgi:hypothetical protein
LSHASHAKAAWVNALLPAGKPGPELTLVSGGNTDYTVVLPEQPTSQDEKAAEELTRWLREMSGVSFPLVREGGEGTLSGLKISIGRTALLGGANLAEAGQDLGDEGYAVAVNDETLFLFGGRRRGAISAVLAFLEEDLACRWYTRTENRIPYAENVARRHGVRFLMEGPPDLEDQLTRWRVIADTPAPEFPGSVVAEESQTDYNPNCGHLLVEDENASAGFADRVSNNYANTDFAVNWTLPPDIINSGATYRLRVRVRLNKTGDQGLGFRAGVWDLIQGRKTIELNGVTLRNEPILVLHKVWDAKDVPGDTYHWYDVGEFTPTQPPGAEPGRLRVFIGGASNPYSDVQGLFFDRAELVPL